MLKGLALRSASGVTSSGAGSDRVGGAAASGKRGNQVVVEGVVVRDVDRIAGSCASICYVRCVALFSSHREFLRGWARLAWLALGVICQR